MGPVRPTRVLAYAWVLVLSALVIGPALGPGFALTYDLVFTPRQDLLPGSIGVGGGLPRAVPQDAVVALVEYVVPGSILEKLVLLAIPVIVGTGMLRLVPGTAAGTIAATVAVANPFVAQRLVIGHWGFLLAYALVPWGLVVARRARASGDAWDGVRLLLIVAVGSLTPSGSVLLTVLVVPVALLPGSALTRSGRGLLLAAVSATWLPWLLPALLHGDAGRSDVDGASLFALRPDAPGGALASALAGGGIWNAEAVLPSRGSALSLVLLAGVLGLAAWGARRLVARLGRLSAAWWGGVAVVGLLAALSSALVPGPWSSLLDVVPGAGLARDSHKLLAPWVLLLAAAAGSGGGRLVEAGRDRATQAAIAVACVLVPLACQFDLLWGASGRLDAVEYPADWAVVRQTLQTDPRPGDIVSFPWTAFRRFDWNDGRTVLDPAPRWLPRTTVVSDVLEVRTPTGIVRVDGDDPRATAITQAVDAGGPLAGLLPELGIGWALVASGTPGPIPDLPGWIPVVAGPGLTLYAAPEGTVRGRHVDTRVVAVVDVLVGAGLAAALLALGTHRIRRVRSRTS